MGRPCASMPLAQFKLGDKGNGGEKLSVGAIEDVKKSVTIRLEQQFSRLALINGIDEHGSFGGVIVVEIVGRELKIPFHLAGVGVDREDASGVEIVAGARPAVEIGGGIAGAPINSVEIGIVSAGHPGGAAAAKIKVARPAVGTEFAGAGNGP